MTGSRRHATVAPRRRTVWSPRPQPAGFPARPRALGLPAHRCAGLRSPVGLRTSRGEGPRPQTSEFQTRRSHLAPGVICPHPVFPPEMRTLLPPPRLGENEATAKCRPAAALGKAAAVGGTGAPGRPCAAGWVPVRIPASGEAGTARAAGLRPGVSAAPRSRGGGGRSKGYSHSSEGGGAGGARVCPALPAAGTGRSPPRIHSPGKGGSETDGAGPRDLPGGEARARVGGGGRGGSGCHSARLRAGQRWAPHHHTLRDPAWEPESPGTRCWR